MVGAILLFYVVLGAVMDELSMLLLTIPIFFPMIMGLDFGMPKESVAIWFGIMVLMTVGFGLLAPPVGLNVYVVNGLAKDVPISESYKRRDAVPDQRHAAHACCCCSSPAISLYVLSETDELEGKPGQHRPSGPESLRSCAVQSVRGDPSP